MTDSTMDNDAEVLTRTRFNPSLRGAQPLMVSLSNHVAISMRLNTRRRTAVATATRLPPPHQVRGRNDEVGTRERRGQVADARKALDR